MLLLNIYLKKKRNSHIKIVDEQEGKAKFYDYGDSIIMFELWLKI